MNLTELKSAVATESGLTQADSEKAVKAVFEVISNTLACGDSITITGFGVFSVK